MLAENQNPKILSQVIQTSNFPITFANSLVQKLQQPLNESDYIEFNKLCAEFGVNVDNPCQADFVNLTCVKRSKDDCAKCTGVNRSGCKKTEIALVEGRIKTFQVPCNRLIANRIIKKSGVPDIFVKCRAFDWKINESNKSATILATNAISDNKGAYLYGDVGTGKTMLSSIIVNERAYANKQSLFYTVTDMLEDLRDFDNPVKRMEKLNKLKTVPCLVIDDLGAEYCTGWVSSTIFTILDNRYKKNLQTVINSNFGINELAEHIGGYHGERIVRRIQSLCDVAKVGRT